MPKKKASTTLKPTPEPELKLPHFTYNEETQKWDCDDMNELPAQLTALFKTGQPHLAYHMLIQVMNSLDLYHPEKNPIGATPSAVLRYVREMNPQNVMETQIVLNMFCLYEASQLYTKKLYSCEFLKQADQYTRNIKRLSDAYAKQASTLAKLRGKIGNIYMQQVNVNEGGQAVVGQGG